jgi:hypothetical protein
MRIVFPPVETDLFSFVHRTYQESHPDGQQFNIGQGNAHVSRNHQSLVKDAVQNIEQIRGSGDSRYSFHDWHSRVRENQKLLFRRVMLIGKHAQSQRQSPFLLGGRVRKSSN